MSKKETYEQKAEALILPIVEANGFELVDVEYVKEGGSWYLRAYIDNDNRYVREGWQSAQIDHAQSRLYTSAARVTDGHAEIEVSGCVDAVTVEPFVRFTGVWSVYADGTFEWKLDCKRNTNLYDLPRFGLRMFLPKSLDNVSYLGYGPRESYLDKHRSSWWGKFDGKVDDLAVDYIRPQENGSRCGCEKVVLSAEDGSALTVTGHDFSFNASHVTQEELIEKRHNYELEACGSTVLCLDYKMSGVGSNSCGPTLLEKYRLLEPEFTFRMRVSPTL